MGYYSHLEFVYGFTSVVSITYFAALSIGLLVEWPMSKITSSLEAKIFSRASTKTTDYSVTIKKVTGDKKNFEIESVVDEEQRLLLSANTDKETYSSYKNGS